MKKILLGIIVFVAAQHSHAQGRIYASLDDIYRDFMLQSHTQFNKSVLNDFQGLGGANRFMSSQWLQGAATNNFEASISGNYLFNYDFMGHELHAKWKDTCIIVNTSYVKRFFLVDNNKSHFFVKCQALDGPGQYFFESLAFDQDSNDSAKVQLLKLRKIKSIKTNKNDYLANFSGDYSDTFDEKLEYYLVLPDQTYSKVKLNKRSLADALEKYKTKADAFLKDNNVADEDNAAALIRYVNK
ncbi:MAG: hypothetical protein ACKVOW_11865 [Chitinophagaceae bacterium]